MNEGCNNVPSFVALAFLAYQVLSNTELALLAISMMVITFLVMKLILLLWGYMGSTSLKTSRPHSFPCEEKSTSQESKCEN
jgi:hypothetical protein